MSAVNAITSDKRCLTLEADAPIVAALRACLDVDPDEAFVLLLRVRHYCEKYANANGWIDNFSRAVPSWLFHIHVDIFSVLHSTGYIQILGSLDKDIRKIRLVPMKVDEEIERAFKCFVDCVGIGRAAEILEQPADLVLGRFLRVWTLFAAGTVGGLMRGVDEKWFDARFAVPGFASALHRIGWLIPMKELGDGPDDPTIGLILTPQFEPKGPQCNLSRFQNRHVVAWPRVDWLCHESDQVRNRLDELEPRELEPDAIASHHSDADLPESNADPVMIGRPDQKPHENGVLPDPKAEATSLSQAAPEFNAEDLSSLRAAIAMHKPTSSTKTILKEAGGNRKARLAGLRHLETVGEYKGFKRAPRTTEA